MVSSSGASSDHTGKSADRRKLVAVVYADMVGYSRLIGLDDIGTLDRLRRLRREVIDPAIEEYGGRIVQTGGDSLLIVFDSIDGAVRCAVKVQQQLPILGGDQPPDRAIRFRVGINLGDAIADGTDLHGDAVNVASRLQAECPPGGICVSRSVRDHVHGRLGLEFKELGTLNLKNIARPVEAFIVRLEADANAPKTKTFERSLSLPEVLLLPDKPSIAVLPFTNMSGDLEQEYFSDGIADEIITELSRSRSLFVIARNSSFTYRGRAVPIKQIAHELGVRYVLEGSVRRSGGRVRVIAQLIDAETGNHIWAERYDREVGEVFAVQDEITNAVTQAIGSAVADAEQRRSLRKPPENLSAWEAYQRGLWHFARGTAFDNDRAIGFFERSIELDPLFGAPHAMLSFAYLQEPIYGTRRTFRESLERAEPQAQRASGLDPDDTNALAALSWVAHHHGDLASAVRYAERAISINCNDSSAHLTKGHSLVFAGRHKKGREALYASLRLNPRGPTNIVAHVTLAVSDYFQRDYVALAASFRQLTSAFPTLPNIHRWFAACLGQLGQTDEASKMLSKALELSPQGFDIFVRNCPAHFRPEDHEHMLDGLRKAGWQG